MDSREFAGYGVVRPLGETRPAWKVLRVLANVLDLPGFDFETSEQVRDLALGGSAELAGRLSNRAASDAALGAAVPASSGLERLADVPIYATDTLVRRAPALQHTADAAAPQAGVPRSLWSRLGLKSGDRVVVAQGEARAVLPVRLDDTLADGVVRVPAGHLHTATLGAMFGAVTLTKA